MFAAVTSSDPAVSIVDDAEAHRFETSVDGHLAFLQYRQNGNRFVIVHTEVPEALSGRGIGGALVEKAIEKAADAGLVVVPNCPFAHGWLKRHPEVAGHVTIDWPEASP
jgi:hypothetical protein